MQLVLGMKENKQNGKTGKCLMLVVLANLNKF